MLYWWSKFFETLGSKQKMKQFNEKIIVDFENPEHSWRTRAFPPIIVYTKKYSTIFRYQFTMVILIDKEKKE
jgi:hypothetical protein